MITQYLKDNNLIICPNNLKKKIIKLINKNNELISYKIMDIKTFLENYFFRYDKKTVYYLMNKLDLKYDIILEYLNSLYYIENKKYNSKKLNELANLKNELIENDLLYSNHIFKKYLNNTSVIVYGYNELDDFYLNILKKASSFNYIKTNYNKFEHIVYEFDDIEDEVAYICHDIKKKLDSGVDINKIKLISPASEYNAVLKRIFLWTHIPINLENKISLYNLKTGKEVLDKIKENISFNDILTNLEDKIDSNIYNQLINIFNSYINIECDVNNLYDLIEYDLKNTYLKQENKENCVNICSIEEVEEDDYGYLLGFNKENYPIIYKDEDFLSDTTKQELNLFTSNENNIIERNKLINNLYSNKNIIITYKLKTAFNSYNPCLLIKEENFKIERNPAISFNISHLYNQMKLAKEYDKFHKYGVLSNELKLLMPNYSNLSYRTYDNSFTGLDNSKLINYLKQPFNLSYSTVDEYYRCSFRYYISNILKIKEENIDEFYMNIGNIFHYVLSKCFDNDSNFESSWNFEASKYDFTFDKIILLDKLKKELKYDIEILKKHRSYSYFDENLYEKRFSIQVPNKKNIDINFVGIVDKISYMKLNNKTLVSVIDYKTGHLPSNLNNIIYGIGMQLPIYLYFIKRSSLFDNAMIVGFYLQKIINKDVKATTGKTVDELKENALKLVGYSTDNEEFLEKFDMTYHDSQVISGLKKKKEGFYAYSKILSDKQMENLDNLVENKIIDATNNILDGKFDINPKKIDKDIIGCEFCSYRDICYKTEKDYLELEKYKNLDFLGGDNNA